jgi:hypothetical protein
MFANDHEEWCEGTGPVITRQPYPKGAKASPKGNHEVENDKRKTASFWEVFYLVEEKYMYPSFIYTSNKRIRCFFFTVVVKNKSLVKYYQGGLKGYIEKYYPLCNQDISVRVYMAGNDVYNLLGDLIKNGLKIGKDFNCFDASDLAFDIECTWRKNIDLGVE